MDRDEFARTVQTFLPAYLSAADYRRVADQLSGYPDCPDVYWRVGPGPRIDDPLQGDCWSNIPIRNSRTGVEKKTSCLILSNSCDIDRTNQGTPDRMVVVCPTISPRRYADRAAQVRGHRQSTAILEALRKQQKSHVAYFPATPVGHDERIALLDHVYSVPLDLFYESRRDCVFRLNMTGFYILLLKISIHFTRMQEGIARAGPSPQPQ